MSPHSSHLEKAEGYAEQSRQYLTPQHLHRRIARGAHVLQKRALQFLKALHRVSRLPAESAQREHHS